MFSARHGHAVVVLNQPNARPYLTEEENSERLRDANTILVLLGGDDGLLPGVTSNQTSYGAEMGIGSGKLRNDVWIGEPTPGLSQSSWRVDDRYYMEGEDGYFNPELIRSEMRWVESTPGRVVPATWPSSSEKYSHPLSNDEWIACQDSIKEKLAYTAALPDPSICDDPPQYCFEDINNAGCFEQAVWKKDNMWSPRRGLGAVVANDKLVVIGGQAREYARIDDARLVGGLGGQKRIETVREHSTIREEIVLKNDVWVSSDGKGFAWELTNPGCKVPQEDVLLQTEVWSSLSDPTKPKFVGSSQCYRSSDCYGVAECKALGNTPDKVCVCPMFSPRTDHAVVKQHRYSIQEDGSVFAQDVIYVIGGFINVKQAFCANRSCGPSDGYKLAVDDVWMSSDNGLNWIQIRPAFSDDGIFRGRGGHTAVIVPYSHNVHGNLGNTTNEVEGKDRLFIFGGESASPVEHSTTFMNDVVQINLPREPCCIPTNGCTDNSQIYNETCLPGQSDWKLMTSNADWPKRTSHTTVYEPPSSANAFRHRIYLIGGKNMDTVLSDVWTWDLAYGNNWKCDYCPSETTSGHDVFLSIDSPLVEVKIFQLPQLDDKGELFNFTNHTVFPVVTDMDIAVMASEGVHTIRDLASADLYTVVKLRGFDFPGRYAREVGNICYLRAISIAVVDKCSVKDTPSSHFHRKSFRMDDESSNKSQASSLCGRGGDTKPCVRGDWDGCTPIPGTKKVDVHGLGDVTVPQIQHDASSALEELFCRQVPDGRYHGGADFLDNKVVLLGGIGNHNNSTRLYRDVWSRDESFPRAFITSKPVSRSPQSQFYFDSNEAGAVFEYKLMLDDGSADLTPWITTTKSIGANVDWLDDKIGGPGKGWYILYVRSVDPAGNRDTFFSTQTNVYRWYYIPPIPWGSVSGCIIAILVVIAASYYEYRRRKRRAVMQRFQLRRLRRKFKLKNAKKEVHARVFQDRIPHHIGEGGSRRRPDSSSGHRSSSTSRHTRRSQHSRSRRKARRDGSQELPPRSSGSHRRHRDHRSHSNSRSKSKSRSSSHNNDRRQELRRRRHQTPEQLAEQEARERRRAAREKLKRELRH